MTAIVTAFVDIGRESWEGIINDQRIPSFIKRDTETYFRRFERLSKLKNKIICYTESRFFDKISKMNSTITLINIDSIWKENEKLLALIENIQKNSYFIKSVNNPASPEYWSSKYVAINLLKSTFVNHAINDKLIDSENIAWIDFGYCRENVYCPENKYWNFDTSNLINLFCQNFDLYSKPIFEIVKTGEVYIQGCHIVAPQNKWPLLQNLVNSSLNNLTSVGLIDDDQTFLLMAYQSNPEIFKLNPANSNNWFTIFEGRCN